MTKHWNSVCGKYSYKLDVSTGLGKAWYEYNDKTIILTIKNGVIIKTSVE